MAAELEEEAEEEEEEEVEILAESVIEGDPVVWEERERVF